MSRTGLLGGVFDPIHHGHLFLAHYAKEALQLDQILLIPSGKPPHKNQPLASVRHRREMVWRALEETSFEGCYYEIDGNSRYTIDTINHLKEVYPTEFYFIIGADNIQEMPSWKNWEDIFNKVEVVVMERPGYSMDESRALFDRWSPTYLTGPTPDISSTRIREMIAMKNIYPKYLVPESVLEYIAIHGLYRDIG